MRQDYVDVHDDLRCCGLVELSGIGGCTAEQAARDILTSYDGEYDPPQCAQIIFTQATRNRQKVGYGYNLAKFVAEHNLGSVAASAPKVNPNSSNIVTCFVWTPNYEGIRAWVNGKEKRRKRNA